MGATRNRQSRAVEADQAMDEKRSSLLPRMAQGVSRQQAVPDRGKGVAWVVVAMATLTQALSPPRDDVLASAPPPQRLRALLQPPHQEDHVLSTAPLAAG